MSHNSDTMAQCSTKKIPSLEAPRFMTTSTAFEVNLTRWWMFNYCHLSFSGSGGCWGHEAFESTVVGRRVEMRRLAASRWKSRVSHKIIGMTATHHTTTRIRKRPSKRRKGCAVASLDGADGQDFCLFQTPDVSACLVALRRRYPTRMIVWPMCLYFTNAI